MPTFITKCCKIPANISTQIQQGYFNQQKLQNKIIIDSWQEILHKFFFPATHTTCLQSFTSSHCNSFFFFAFIGLKGKNHFPWWCWSPQFWKSGLAVCLKSPKPWSYQSVQSLDEADVWGDFPSCNCLKSPIGLLPLIHTKVWVDLQAQQLPCSSVPWTTEPYESFSFKGL